MSQEVREPQQKRSIDKKNRIIEAGYELFAKDGYFNTNTSEIAKKAGVSTGIVYGYFHDKRDILIEVDGGVKQSNAARVIDAGADVLVMGTGLFRAEDPKAVVQSVMGA